MSAQQQTKQEEHKPVDSSPLFNHLVNSFLYFLSRLHQLDYPDQLCDLDQFVEPRNPGNPHKLVDVLSRRIVHSISVIMVRLVVLEEFNHYFQRQDGKNINQQP